MLEACFFGFSQPYEETMSLMDDLHQQVANNELPHQLMLLEHSPVITITKQHLLKSVKTSKENIESDGIALCSADRGGDVTFHGPGQLVGYPILNLKDLGRNTFDVVFLIRSLELALLNALSELGLDNCELLPGFSGVWLKVKSGRLIKCKKLIAIGMGIKNGVSKHGFALNLDIDHDRFSKHIVPCGLKDRGVISLKEAFLLQSLDMPSYDHVIDKISHSLCKTFSLTLKWRKTSMGVIHGRKYYHASAW